MKTLLCSHIERVQEIDKKVDALSSVLSERCGELERRQLEIEREFYTKIQALEAQISDRSEEWENLLAQDHAKLMAISHGAIKHELKEELEGELLETSLSRPGIFEDPVNEREKRQVSQQAEEKRREVPQLAEDIERLGRLAYPEVGHEVQDVLCKDQFIDALHNEELRLKIRQARPGTMREALTAAVELESFTLASEQRHGLIREVKFQDERKERRKEGLDEQLLQIMHRIETSVKELFSKIPGAEPSAKE
ncbi:predicted protein [Nematostella vectensis]|uniref:Uncharacterized protein n=1 Tax=Nematostella vectensis TaxID=45351 RepID=A7TBY1_NEMVE|nr:predicted protein [Nematostella vectensis]|eukprot:XP_001618570.1 hypothetical protein NEMVEDRAFT_v1g225000 [Nematostella vectensis]